LISTISWNKISKNGGVKKYRHIQESDILKFLSPSTHKINILYAIQWVGVVQLTTLNAGWIQILLEWWEHRKVVCVFFCQPLHH